MYGAASMGALRAAECARFGMKGVGRVFELYRDGVITRDDEVAVAYDPDSGHAVSESLVGIRIGLDSAVLAGLVDPRTAGDVLDEVSTWPWRDRLLPRVARLAGGDPAASAELLAHLEATNVKASDAEAVLRLVARGFQPPSVPPAAETDLPCRTSVAPLVPPFREMPPTRKVGAWDSTRSVPPSETLSAFDRVRGVVGITRVGDVTGLDVLGIPNVVAIRPSRDPMCNSAYSGKGLRFEDALVGAQMEALEVAVGSDDRVRMIDASWSELDSAGRAAVHPDALIPLPTAPRGLADLTVEWLPASDLRSGEPVLVPADCVVFRRHGAAGHWKISSNGLASGNTVVEATSHAIAELIERDAESHFRVASEYAHLPGLMRIVVGPPRVAAPDRAGPPVTSFPLIRLDRLPAELEALVVGVRKAGIDVAVRVITSDVEVPTLLCAFHERTPDSRRHLVHYGCGTHPDAFVAARRAITEAAQSRVTAMQGVREDMAAGAICPADPPADWFHPDDPGVELGDLPRATHADVRDDLGYMLDALDRAALDQALAVNLSHDAICFPVVKAVVPGLELAFHSPDPDRIALGWRARRFYPDRLDPEDLRRA